MSGVQRCTQEPRCSYIESEVGGYPHSDLCHHLYIHLPTFCRSLTLDKWEPEVVMVSVVYTCHQS